MRDQIDPNDPEAKKKLEEAGFITAYRALVDPRKMGWDVTAFIGTRKVLDDVTLVVLKQQ